MSKHPKEETRLISSHLDETSLFNKGLIIWLSEKVFLRDRWVSTPSSCFNKGLIIWLSGKCFLLDTVGSAKWAR